MKKIIDCKSDTYLGKYVVTQDPGFMSQLDGN